MNKKSQFLPTSISDMLRKLFVRGVGILFCLISLWLVFALFFYDPYLSGFAAHGTFGNQGVIGNIVIFVRYVIGFIPALFLFMCLGRFGLSLFVGWDEERAPEYNLLRGFVTLCIGCAALGLMWPNKSYGGLAGAIVGGDIAPMLGVASLPIGIILFGLFLVMSAILLHIKWSHVKTAFISTVNVVKWLLSVFHLITPIEPEESEEEYEEEVEEENDDDEEEEIEEDKRKKVE